MTARRICALFLLIASLSRADSSGDGLLAADEYRAQLDRLTSATQQLDSSSKTVPPALHGLPENWRVQTGQGYFVISSEGLVQDIHRYESDKSAANALSVRRRLQMLRAEIDGFDKQPADLSASHSQLNSILSRPEFSSVKRGSTWLDRFRDWLADVLLRALRRVFHRISIPTINKNFVYGLGGLALLALIWIAYRILWRGREMEHVVPKDLPVSAKEWSIWLAEARAAAAKGEWRDAIHLAYWAGISFLERQGLWKPDRARTPREYLRLLSSSAEQRETLIALTRIFELAWYAKRDVSEANFAQTVAELEKLGCR